MDMLQILKEINIINVINIFYQIISYNNFKFFILIKALALK